jgi:pyruvate dehydrogenase E1 component beta subunit
MTRMRMRQAVIAALADELEADPDVILLGEDIGAAGGAFKATEGLLERFGPVRVRDTPISETAILGAAVGAAAAGLRPVVEMMFIEFIGVALDQLTTQAASLRYLSRGGYQVPMTVRAACGAGLGFGCQHSQLLEHWFRGTPGLAVVVPSGAATAYGLLRAAIRSDDPVVFLEHKALYGERQDVALGEDAILPLGRARLARPGADVTLVGLGATTATALRAAELGYSWDAEVIDLLTVAPWDRRAVIESVSRTGRLVTVEEGGLLGGWGAPVCDETVAALWGHLLAPPTRVTCPDVPVPYAAELERRFLPDAHYLAEQVDELVRTARRPAPWWIEPAMSPREEAVQ